MINQVKAPNNYDRNSKLIFLCGSIEMGKAEEWQERLYKLLVDRYEDKGWDLTVLNPRRTDWDSSWIQSVDNRQFNEQVTWELDGIENSSMVVFYFDPKTKSPITLYELGLVSNTSKTVYVVCPEGYFRKGNVDIICKRNQFQQFNSLEELAMKIIVTL